MTEGRGTHGKALRDRRQAVALRVQRRANGDGGLRQLFGIERQFGHPVTITEPF
ncbi:hypothetical protein D3C85_1728530 [compost metagenome]